MADVSDQAHPEWLSRILDAIADAVVVIDEDHTILYLNPAAEAAFGYSTGELLGRPLDMLLPAGAGARHQRHVRDFAAAGSPGRPMTGRVPARGRRKDGSEFPTETSIARLAEGDRTLMVAILRDITQRQHAEEARRESEARYQALFENSIDGVLLTEPGGRIFAANPEACRLLGRTEDELRRAGSAALVDPTDPRLDEVLAERDRTGRFRRELTLVRGDGMRFPAEVSSGVFRDSDGSLRSSIVFRDVTERVQAYQLLEQRVAERTRELAALLEVGREVASTLALAPLLNTILTHLRTVVDYTGAGIAIRSGGEMEMLDYAGPVPCHKMVGARISLAEDTGYRRVAESRAPVIIDDLWAEIPWLQEAWSSQDEELMAAMRSTHSWLGVPLLAKGELIGLLRLDHFEPGHFTPRHAEQALAFANQAAVAVQNARLYEQAQQAAALEERQRLSRELHDSISQALYGIVLGARTAAKLLGRDPQAAADPIRYVLGLAETALAEMRAMIFELRPDSLATEGLVAALQRQIDLIGARHRLAMAALLGEEPAVHLDVKEALYRVAQEALNNISRHAQAQHVTVRLASGPDDVMLEISDDGRGFDPEVPHPGHMGRQSMRERAERVGGACQIESSPGLGTTVRVRIPAAPP